jgi:hypothetical protein
MWSETKRVARRHSVQTRSIIGFGVPQWQVKTTDMWQFYTRIPAFPSVRVDIHGMNRPAPLRRGRESDGVSDAHLLGEGACDDGGHLVGVGFSRRAWRLG